MQDQVSTETRGLGPPVDELLALRSLGLGRLEHDGHTDPLIAVALSGGGFRATLSAIGVLRFLADAGLLARVRASSSVSGGSIANGLFAARWSELRALEFTRQAFDELVLAPLVDRISRRSLQKTLYRNVWRTIGPKSFTDLLAQKFDTWFFDGIALDAIPDQAECRFVFNASDIRTGRRYGFLQEDMGEWIDRRYSNAGVRLAQAVAASCAVPGVFPPLEVSVPSSEEPPILLDGGVYDTLGVDPIDHPDSDGLMISINAGGIYHKAGLGRMLPRVTALLRSSEMSHLLNTSQRMRVMAERFHTWQLWRDSSSPGDAPPDWSRRGVQFGLETRFSELPDAWLPDRPEMPAWSGKQDADGWVDEVAGVETSLERFPLDRCQSLIYRAWWLTGASLAWWHPEVLPTERYPVWSDW